MLLSICIPTFNRSEKLKNCLNSILISLNCTKEKDFEICISDNNSNDNTEEIVSRFKQNLNINYQKNEENLGFALNAIKVVQMAKGKYTWMLGDDDLILPETLSKISKILKDNNSINIFYINSFYLNSLVLDKFTSPFDTKNLNLDTMGKLSKFKESKIVNYWDLINPKISWEFLISIFLIIFKTSDWLEASKKVHIEKLKEKGIWSNFENTCFFPIVNTYAFKSSKAYICSTPLSVNIIGYREWKNYYELVEIIRLPELLDFYRKNGLPLLQYLYCKNYALRNFFSYFLKIILFPKEKGRKYINFRKHFFKNLFFPNVYYSVITFLMRKIKKIFFIKR